MNPQLPQSCQVGLTSRNRRRDWQAVGPAELFLDCQNYVEVAAVGLWLHNRRYAVPRPHAMLRCMQGTVDKLQQRLLSVFCHQASGMVLCLNPLQK